MSMYDTSNWDFFCCLPKSKQEQRDGTWLLEKLRQLWLLGYGFLDFTLESEDWPLTWEEQLSATGKIAVGIQDSLEGTFIHCIEQLFETQGSIISMSNSVAVIDLQPYFLQTNPYLDWLHVSVSGIQAKARRDEKDGEQYLAVQQSFVACCKLVCEIFEPLFGFGSQMVNVEDDDSQSALLRNEGQELLQGTLPPIDEWFYEPPLRYVAPQFVTPELTMSYLSHQHWQVERLSTNGLFVTPTYPEYTYSGSEALRYLAKGKTDVRAARRALEIFETIGDKENVRRADSLIPE